MNELAQPNKGLLEASQIRLSELSVYNWGSFHGLHHATIDPQGTLITGNNGSGKSTLIDGLMALLLPAGKASFNIAAAQGDRSDRSLMSYIRGSYGSAHDGAHTKVQAKREGASATALRANYQGDDGSQITLAALFWTAQPGNNLSDLSRLYVVARGDYRLEQMLASFGQGDARGLKAELRNNKNLSLFDGSFAAYQETWQRLLRMENRNAPALLSRALGLKKIDDLTQLIRELVLEPSTVREDAQRAVAEFADLRSTHHQLEDARRQRDALIELPRVHQLYTEAAQSIEQIQRTQAQLQVWFARQRETLLQARIKREQHQLEQLQHSLKSLIAQLEQAGERERELYADYRQAGGDRIESLKKDLAHCRDNLARVGLLAGQWQSLSRELELPDQLDHDTWQTNAQLAEEALASSATQRTQAQDAFGSASGTLSQLKQQLRQLEQEHAAIEARPDSNIDPAYQKLRDQLAESLDIPREELMYLAELIDVDPDHRDWQGAIERALGGLRVTLAVPQAHYPQVTAWVNARHTGLHVRLQVVGSGREQARFHDDGYLRKLVWRKHPWRDWLKQHLARFDLHCVSSTKELDHTAHAMTREGMVQHELGRFEKKDQHTIDNRRYWSLGFSNKSRLSLLKQEIEQGKQTLHEHNKAEKVARQAMDSLEKRARQWQQLADLHWDSIDVPQHRTRERQLQLDIEQLQSSTGTLAQAKTRWEEAKVALGQLEAERETTNKSQWALESSLASHQKLLALAAQLSQAELDDSVADDLLKQLGALDDQLLEQSEAMERGHQAKLSQKLQETSAKQQYNANRAIGFIVRFRENWTAISADWGNTVADADDYLQHLEQLQRDGLPELVERFRARLNHHATQSLAGIREKIASEREDIRERIAVINTVLRRTEFRDSSYLHLGNRRERFVHVTEFEQHLTSALAAINSDEHEARYRQLEAIIAVLDKASSTATANTLESLRLLDPRHQMSFYAEERADEDDRVLDVLQSSSGKSGGEKEAFAGTIVAASLAYVLTPEGSEHPVYCTVFLDEAFSNTAESVSRRVLRVFRELHIHINLITPFKNLNLAQESARSLLIAERDAAKHESSLCSMSWEELERRQAEAAGVVLEIDAQ